MGSVCDVGHFLLQDLRQDRQAILGMLGADDDGNAFISQQFGGGVDRFLQVVDFIGNNQLDFLSEDTAGSVDFINRQGRTVDGKLAGCLVGTGPGSDLADADLACVGWFFTLPLTGAVVPAAPDEVATVVADAVVAAFAVVWDAVVGAVVEHALTSMAIARIVTNNLIVLFISNSPLFYYLPLVQRKSPNLIKVF